MKITKEIIKDYFKINRVEVDSNYVYVYEQPKTSSYMLFGALAAINMKYYIAVFEEIE